MTDKQAITASEARVNAIRERNNQSKVRFYCGDCIDLLSHIDEQQAEIKKLRDGITELRRHSEVHSDCACWMECDKFLEACEKEEQQ